MPIHEYKTKSGNYVFYTDEPLTTEEKEILDDHEDAVVKMFRKRIGTRVVPAQIKAV